MNNPFGIILIIIGIFAVLIFSAFFLKTFITRIIEPKLSFVDITDFANSNNSIYVEHKKISKKEFDLNIEKSIDKNVFKNRFLLKSQFKLITYSKDKKSFNLYWVEITKCFHSRFIVEILIGENLKNVLGIKYIEETNQQKLREIQSECEIKKVIINEICPACGIKIQNNEKKCIECRINLSL